MADDFNLRGIEEMLKNLQKVGSAVAKRAPSMAVRAGSKPIIKSIRNRAPRQTGSLRKSIGVKVKNYRPSSAVTAIIGARSKSYQTAEGKRNPSLYSHLAEFGTAPHRLGSQKKIITRRGKKHPGAKAQPFMRPGWDAAAPAAVDATIGKVKDVFEAEAKKVAVK